MFDLKCIRSCNSQRLGSRYGKNAKEEERAQSAASKKGFYRDSIELTIHKQGNSTSYMSEYIMHAPLATQITLPMISTPFKPNHQRSAIDRDAEHIVGDQYP